MKTINKRHIRDLLKEELKTVYLTKSTRDILDKYRGSLSTLYRQLKIFDIKNKRKAYIKSSNISKLPPGTRKNKGTYSNII